MAESGVHPETECLETITAPVRPHLSKVTSSLCYSALEAQSKLGGEGLIPFYGLMEGGRDGELFAELEDYFYYAQLRKYGCIT